MILTIESNRSTYAQMLQQQIDMMRTTIDNLCMIGQEIVCTSNDIPSEEIDSTDPTNDIPIERPIIGKSKTNKQIEGKRNGLSMNWAKRKKQYFGQLARNG